jgi:hypothetical protein
LSRAKVLSEVDPWQVSAVLQKPCDAGQIGRAIRSALASRAVEPPAERPLPRGTQ